MATKKPSAAQIAARKKFSDIMKAGGFAKKRAAKKTVAKKAVAKKRVTKKNPIILISDTPKKRTVIRRVNPVAKTMSVSKKSAPPIKFPFIVEYNNSGEGKFNVFAGFKYKEDAFAAAKTIAKEFPYLFIRVMSYKNGAM
jgi:ribosomal protein S8E